jgi:hypothetical protein
VRGFDVHAAVVVSASDREGREGLLRYCARPLLSLERLSFQRPLRLSRPGARRERRSLSGHKSRASGARVLVGCGVRIEVAISAGELVDRLTILELKYARLPTTVGGAIKLDLDAVRALCASTLPDTDWLRTLIEELREVNVELWEIEEALRECERHQAFDARFVQLARRVYLANDRRAALKRSVDEQAGSDTLDYKSYALPLLARRAP